MRALVLASLLVLAGCAGFDRARQMPPDEIATLSDKEVCGYLRTFAYKGRVPDAWDEAAVARGLTRCLDEGIERRAEDRKLDALRRDICDRSTSTQDSRCW